MSFLLKFADREYSKFVYDNVFQDVNGVLTQNFTPSKKTNTIFQQILLNINNTKTVDSKDIKHGFHVCFYLDELKYDANYWKNKTQISSTDTLIENYLKTISEQDFQEGAKQKQLDLRSKHYTSELKEIRLHQIKIHEETLKNIKL